MTPREDIMDLNRLYRYLTESPRDGRWMLKKVGQEYPATIEQLNRSGRPVSQKMVDVDGVQRVVYEACIQRDLFESPEGAASARKKRRRRVVRRGKLG